MAILWFGLGFVCGIIAVILFARKMSMPKKEINIMEEI